MIWTDQSDCESRLFLHRFKWLNKLHLNLDASQTLMQFHFLFAFLLTLPCENKNSVSYFTECLWPIPLCVLNQLFVLSCLIKDSLKDDQRALWTWLAKKQIVSSGRPPFLDQQNKIRLLKQFIVRRNGLQSCAVWIDFPSFWMLHWGSRTHTLLPWCRKDITHICLLPLKSRQKSFKLPLSQIGLNVRGMDLCSLE